MSEDLVPISEDELLLLLLRVWVGTYVVGTAARFHLFFSYYFVLCVVRSMTVFGPRMKLDHFVCWPMDAILRLFPRFVVVRG